MNKDMKKFFEKVSKDNELYRKLFKKSTIKEMYDFSIEETQGNYSEHEFEKLILDILKINLQKNDLYITDKDLNDVGGGKFHLFPKDFKFFPLDDQTKSSLSLGMQLGDSLKKIWASENNNDKNSLEDKSETKSNTE
ncbi:MAG: hypothetical protein RsTaC01_0742 [Candidatus Paraimprobicoccus trichonymphae]|uniref:Uncharacterized protein n=1 Tax=Candidatus Paraimprobicoccus trichonymphae TaxID=3033793 RepID=A0AA48KZF5_9FIRM|nr:MAG: hypothetical protein RsTaC01_0742 [Candidatus Paraimprobicoccus trichonymphae]